jgi:hypothetical protein
MTDSDERNRHTDEAPTRRRVLAATGAMASGLAGCVGGGGDGGGEPTDTPTATPSPDRNPTPTDTEAGTPSPAETAAISCEAMDEGGYERYTPPESTDSVESQFVATFEYPAAQEEGEGINVTSCVNGILGLAIRTRLSGEPFDLIPRQKLEGVAERTAAMKGEVEGLQQVGEFEYDGETLPLVRSSGGPNEDDVAKYRIAYPYYVVGLPYEESGERAYYRFDLKGTVGSSQRLEATQCGETWAEVSERVIRSLEPYPDTTIRQQDGC